MYISTKKLYNNENVVLSALEIKSIPHISIIDNNKSEIEVNENTKMEMKRLLKEFSQVIGNREYNSGICKDISIELLWKTSPVKNQPFKAKIGLFIIFRAIDADVKKASASVEALNRLCQSSLVLQKYSFEDVKYSDLYNVIDEVEDFTIKAIIKNEDMQNLQNEYLPFCYSYDKIPKSTDDLSSVVNTLIEYPGAAISIQLIPTNYTREQIATIENMTQVLENLSNGVVNQGVGNISYVSAGKYAKLYQYYSENKNDALFIYNIVVYGNERSTSNIARRLLGHISSGDDGSASLKLVSLNKNEVDKNQSLYPLPWVINETLINKEREFEIWNSGQFSPAFYALPYIITAEEAVELFRLPIGGNNISAGLDINESAQTGKTYADNIINDGDISFGRLKSSNNSSIGISLNDLAKHLLVVGTPGSGKTTFSVGLLDRLWKEHKIPFLVIEPAKNEYRALVQSIPELQVFTPGKNTISPFVFNPFVPPKNVKLETYKSTLKTAFAAGVSMSSPLDKIFEEAINNCYSDFRWLDTYTSDDKGLNFNISDFIKCFQETFDKIGYTGDAKNIGRAGTVRLKSLVNLFDNYFSIPIEDILEKPTVIELAAIENNSQKALIISLLLLSILAYVNANYVGEGGLRSVILLEESHVLLDTMSDGTEDANPSMIAQGLLKRMLAEIRSYGVGMIVADQSPRKVGSDIVALTDMKMIFRLVESEDKHIIANSTGMSDIQEKRMGKLKPGEAFMFFNRLEEPEEIITPNYRLEHNISISLSDDGIKELSQYWKSRAEFLRPYPQCKKVEECQSGCVYEKRILSKEIARRLFNKYIDNSTNVKNDFILVIKNLPKLVKKELDSELYSDDLLHCIMVHLLRNVRYSTKIKFSENTEIKLLSR